MKTLKALKITSIIQIIYCIYCSLIALLLVIGSVAEVNLFLRVGTFLFFYTVEFSMFIVPVCFIVNLVIFLKERKYPEEKKAIGKKWIWIFIWPIIAAIFFLLQALPFIRVPIFN